MKTAIVTGSLLLALAGSAAAQPGVTPPAPMPVYDVEAPPPPSPPPAAEELSEGTALALSLGGTIGSYSLIFGAALAGEGSAEAAGLMATAGAVGVWIAPSFGHWYAGKYFTRGLGMRLGAGAVVVLGALVALGEDPISYGHDDPPEEDGEAVIGPAIMIAGAALFVAGTIDDIVQAPGRVARINRERAGLAVAPLLAPNTAGFSLAGRF
ncbi:MAG TPA: hypothetical protein VNO30_25905 [Kofleriaceae bacterium]|nr:hypothetical protein [Kofleriaceae bacterium]